MADAAGAVADDLHFEVARTRHQPFDVHVGVAEGRSALRTGIARYASSSSSSRVTTRIPRPPPPATALTIIAPPSPSEVRKSLASLEAGRARRAGQHRHSDALRQRPRAHLVAEQLEHLGPRADELDPFFGRVAGEAGILAEEAVAGMDRVASRRFRDRHDLFDVEIGGGADAGECAGLVGLAGME